MDQRNDLLRIASLDGLLCNPARLMLVYLLARHPSLDYTGLLKLTGLSSGNISTHLQKLVQAGYVAQRKAFRHNKPHTAFRLTERGAAAYAQWGENILRALPERIKMRNLPAWVPSPGRHHLQRYFDADWQSRYSNVQYDLNLYFLPPLDGVFLS